MASTPSAIASHDGNVAKCRRPQSRCSAISEAANIPSGISANRMMLPMPSDRLAIQRGARGDSVSRLGQNTSNHAAAMTTATKSVPTISS